LDLPGLLFTYVTWIPLVLVTDRITFDFYILPATGAVCAGIGMAISNLLDMLKNRTIRYGKMTTGIKLVYAGIIFYLVLHLVIFIIANPALPNNMKQWLEPIIR